MHKCTFCGKPSRTNPGPICAKRLFGGQIARKDVAYLLKASPKAMSNISNCYTPEEWTEVIKTMEPDISVGVLKTVPFGEKMRDMIALNRNNESVLMALSMNKDAVAFSESFMTSTKLVRATFIGANHNLADSILVEALTDPSQLVFDQAINHYNVKDTTLAKAFNSNISKERKLQILNHEECPVSAIESAVDSFNPMFVKVVSEKKRLPDFIIKKILAFNVTPEVLASLHENCNSDNLRALILKKLEKHSEAA